MQCVVNLGGIANGAVQDPERIRGEPIFVPAPVDSMHGLWSEPQRLLVESRLCAAVIGGPDTVQQKLARFLSLTKVDELIFASDLYDHRDRLRSFEIAAEAMKTLDEAELQRIQAMH